MPISYNVVTCNIANFENLSHPKSLDKRKLHYSCIDQASTLHVSCCFSGIPNTDQLSIKDSGKGDSDFHDSDSDTSGDGSSKTQTTFNAVQNGKFGAL